MDRIRAEQTDDVNETAHEATSTLSRRGLLKGVGLAALTAGAAGTTAGAALAQSAEPDQVYMRSPNNPVINEAATPTALPSLATIVLNRLAFGPRPGDLAAFTALGSSDSARLTAWVDAQLNPAAINDSACDTRMAAQNFFSLGKSLEQLWTDHMVYDDLPPAEFTGDAWRWHILPALETERATLLRATYSQRQLQEVLADFWHNHFNVYGWDYWTAPVWVHYDRDVIRGHMLGNFRQMLEAVATSPAMLFYLDNSSNSRSGPNENYARELFELHTLGAENYLGTKSQLSVPGFGEGNPVGYVDGDVYEATRCLTGWRVNSNSWENGVTDTGTFLYYEAWHDRFQKIVLGQFLSADQGPMVDGRNVLDALARHPGTGRTIARKLCRRLIGDTPPQSIVEVAAALFTAQVDAPDQLKQVVRAIVLSDEFRSTWGEKIKRPLEYAVSLLRATQAEVMPNDPLIWAYDEMGQGLFNWRAPNGYPDSRAEWSGTMPMLQRWRFNNSLLEGWIEGSTVDILAQTPAAIRTPNALVDFWSTRILGRALAPADRAEIAEFLALGRNVDYDLTQEQIDDRLRHAVGLILMSPEFMWR
ncbi:MAG: DUF1800 domain-containing protein [Caldilineaceae bacterium]|nr:DUF1800 domain-containing protein [Caldilineaceae bacterium]MBP8125703.1 DUF1800 domain-containing protein [Caldilineaceae bacterium]MBP9072476.1 DUF1800 domain-containing protein [Caldilineaceae bacterium]